VILNNFDDDATATQRQLDMQVHKWNWAVDVAFTHAVLLMMEAGAFVNEAPATNLTQEVIAAAMDFLNLEPEFIQDLWFGSSISIKPNDSLHATTTHHTIADAKTAGSYLGRFLRLLAGEKPVDPLESTKVLYMNLFENWRRVCGVVSALSGAVLGSAFLTRLDPSHTPRHPSLSKLRQLTRYVAGMSLFSLSIASDADVQMATRVVGVLTTLLESAYHHKHLLFWLCAALTNMLYPLSRAQTQLVAERRYELWFKTTLQLVRSLLNNLRRFTAVEGCEFAGPLLVCAVGVLSSDDFF